MIRANMQKGCRNMPGSSDGQLLYYRQLVSTSSFSWGLSPEVIPFETLLNSAGFLDIEKLIEHRPPLDWQSFWNRPAIPQCMTSSFWNTKHNFQRVDLLLILCTQYGYQLSTRITSPSSNHNGVPNVTASSGEACLYTNSHWNLPFARNVTVSTTTVMISIPKGTSTVFFQRLSRRPSAERFATVTQSCILIHLGSLAVCFLLRKVSFLLRKIRIISTTIGRRTCGAISWRWMDW